MDYELAKQLKDAGFPQELTDPSSYWVRAESPCFGWSEGEDKPYGEYVKRPTLSELIEACGEEFRSLERLLGGTPNDDSEWIAESRVVQDVDDDEDSGWITERGSTPEEAVARLYLALHPVKEV